MGHGMEFLLSLPFFDDAAYFFVDGEESSSDIIFFRMSFSYFITFYAP